MIAVNPIVDHKVDQNQTADLKANLSADPKANLLVDPKVNLSAGLLADHSADQDNQILAKKCPNV